MENLLPYLNVLEADTITRDNVTKALVIDKDDNIALLNGEDLGTNNYQDLQNKPSLNGKTLEASTNIVPAIQVQAIPTKLTITPSLGNQTGQAVELPGYDTSTNASGILTSQVFGILNDKYTKEEIDNINSAINTAISKKQDKLTAGANIRIVDNVISAFNNHLFLHLDENDTEHQAYVYSFIKSNLEFYLFAEITYEGKVVVLPLVAIENNESLYLKGMYLKDDSTIVEVSAVLVANGNISVNTSEISISDYNQLTNKPQINSVELSGNKTLADLGIQAAGNYALKSDIPTKVSELQNDSQFVTETALTDGLAPKADKTYVDEQLALKADSTTVESLSGEVATNSTDISTLKSTVAENGEKIDSLDKEMATKQDTLVSGESIRTINNLSLLGDGNINVGDVPSITVENEQIPNETDFNRVAEAAANDRAVLIRIKTAEMTLPSNYWQYSSSESQRGFVAYATYLSGTNNITLIAYILENQPVMVGTEIEELQEELVSGTNIKTINGESILGSGNIDTPDSKVTSAANHYTPVGGSATSGTIINSITKDEKGHIVDIGVANGIDASKITSGVIDIERLPKGALERLVIVANQSERYALTADDVQEGDTVKQEDTGVLYFVVDIDNLANENGYSIYTAGSATSVPWSGVTGKPDLVNSVKLVLPSSIFTNSGSILTGNVELGSSLSPQTANTVWAAPSGTSGVPTFRKLTFLDMNIVASDEFNYIPQTFKGGRLVINHKNSAGEQNTNNTITEYQFKDGASNLTYITAKGFKTSENQEHRVLCSDGSSKFLYGPSTPGTAGQVLVSNGTSAPEWGQVPITSIGGPTGDTTTSDDVPYGITPYIGEYRSDKLAFIKSTDLYGEISKNNGELWTEDPQGSSRLINLFTSQDNKYGLQLIDTEDVSVTTQYRLTITNSDRYCTIDWIYIYMSTNGSAYNCFIEAYNPSSESWDIISQDASLQGWSGPNFRALTSSLCYNYSPRTSSQYSKLRFTFSTKSISEKHSGQLTVYRISGYGIYGWIMPNNMSQIGQLYSWDNAQNASFPGSVSAIKFISDGGTSTNVTMGDGSLKDLKTKQLVVNGTINNFYSSDSVEVRLYAPTSGGTSGQILVSNGSNTPKWASLDSLGIQPAGNYIEAGAGTQPQINTITVLTQSEYDGLSTKDSNTQYLIVE